VRVLFVSPVVPYPPITGVRVRMFNLLQELSKRHEITLVCFDELLNVRVDLDHVLELCNNAHVFPTRRPTTPANILDYFVHGKSASVAIFTSPRARSTIARLVAETNFDLVNIHSFYTAHNLPSSCNLPIVIVDHSLQFIMTQRHCNITSGVVRAAFRIDSRRAKRWLIQAWRQDDVCAAVSEAERQIASTLVPSKPIHAVPNGVDESYFRYVDPSARSPATILFVGNFRSFVNCDAIRYFVDEIFPIIKEKVHEAELWVVGNDPPPEIRRLARRPSVQVTGTVPDVRPYLAAASVFICPLRTGSGTRLKILEAMAMGLPIVSTTIGAEGLNVKDKVHILLANDQSAFAEKVVRLLTTPEYGARLGREARELVERNYTWHESAQALETCYEIAVTLRLPAI